MDGLKKVIAFMSGCAFFICIFFFTALTISDQGAKMTHDGMPLTDSATYIWLFAAMIITGLLICLTEIKCKGRKNEKGNKMHPLPKAKYGRSKCCG